MRWGTSFDTLGEAYDLYKLYSWEKGSGIRYEMSKCGEDKVHARNLLWLCAGWACDKCVPYCAPRTVTNHYEFRMARAGESDAV